MFEPKEVETEDVVEAEGVEVEPEAGIRML